MIDTQTTSTRVADKVRLRREGMAAIGGKLRGRIWMPCSGPGDLASELADIWPAGMIDAIDHDKSMIDRWGTVFPEYPATQMKAEKWTPRDGDVYSVADIDAFGSPLRMLRSFLDRAVWTSPALILLTDGTGKNKMLAKRCFDFATLKMGAIDSELAKEQHLNWPSLTVEWIEAHPRVSSARCIDSVRGGGNTARHVWYMSIVIGEVGATSIRRAVVHNAAEAPGMVDGETLSLDLGASTKTVDAWIAEGMPVIRGSGRGNKNMYDPDRCLGWAIRHGKDSVVEKFVTGSASRSRMDLSTERARLARAQTEKTERENALVAGKLVDAGSVTVRLSSLFTHARQKLEALPQAVAGLFPERPEVQGVVEGVVYDVLHELASGSGNSSGAGSVAPTDKDQA